MGQIERKNSSSLRLRVHTKQLGTLNKNELTLLASKHRWGVGNLSSSKTSSLLYSSIASQRANQKKHTNASAKSNRNKTCKISEKQEPSYKSMRSGVYFDNREIFNTRHPSQVHYNVRHVTKVLNLPVGMPLPKPPGLCVINHPFPPLSKPGTEESLQQKTDESQSEKEAPCARKRKREREEKGSEEEGKLEDRPSKRSRIDITVTSISNKKLSSEERLFLEAAIALSASKISGPTKEANTPSQQSEQSVSPKPSGQAMPPPPPPCSFFQGISSRVLLSLGQHS